jgi:hypothetical protein
MRITTSFPSLEQESRCLSPVRPPSWISNLKVHFLFILFLGMIMPITSEVVEEQTFSRMLTKNLDGTETSTQALEGIEGSSTGSLLLFHVSNRAVGVAFLRTKTCRVDSLVNLVPAASQQRQGIKTMERGHTQPKHGDDQCPYTASSLHVCNVQFPNVSSSKKGNDFCNLRFYC